MAIQSFKPNSSGPTASRPSTPDVGWTHWNTDTSVYEVWTGGTWLDISSSTPLPFKNAKASVIQYVGDGTNHRRVDHGIGGQVLFVMIAPRNNSGFQPMVAIQHETTSANVGVWTQLNGNVFFDAHANPVTTFSFWNNDPELIRVGAGGLYNTNGQAYTAFFVNI